MLKQYPGQYIEDITWPHEDMNFIFQWSKLLQYHEKVKFVSSSCCVIFVLSYRQEYFCTNNSVKAGNEVIDILISEDMENMPLESRIKFRRNFTSGLFPPRHSYLYNHGRYVTSISTVYENWASVSVSVCAKDFFLHLVFHGLQSLWDESASCFSCEIQKSH